MLKHLGLVCGLMLALPTQAATLTLQQAVELAIKHDPWLQTSQHQQAAAMAKSAGSGYLPDPKFNVGLANFPTDSFDYNQEAMTQVLIGVSQLLPRGETLSLESQKWLQQAEQQRFLRQERRANLRQQVSELWLMAVKAQQSIELIQQNRILFEQLSDVATSTYSSTYGRSRQQDLVRSKLELSQLDDRLTQLQLQKDNVLAKLGPWLSSPADPAFGYALPKQLTTVISLNPAAYGSPQQVLQHLTQHPSLVAMDQAIAMASTGVSLAEQKYKPEWMINASYGFRGEDPMGNSRADLFSIGVSVDVPIFSSGRQNAAVKGAIAGAEAMRTERLLVLRNLNSRLQGLYAESQQLKKRHQLYQQELIPGFALAAESAINAYTVDDGNFSDVVRARISELNAKLENLAISIEMQKKVVAMNYLLTQANDIEVMDQ